MARRGNKNQVTLTFAGDSSDLQQSFDRVGQSAEGMRKDVGGASDRMQRTGERFDKMRDRTDALDTSAMGFRDTITGVTDTMAGLTDESKSMGERALLLGQGVGDLASSATNLLVPSLKRGVTWIGNTTVAQRALNLAMRLNPIGIVVTVLAALAAGLVVAWKKSETFRNIVTGTWDAIKDGASFAWNNVLKPFLGWFQNLPGNISSAFRNLGNTIKSPFTWAFEQISRLWNSTVGGFGFDIPWWVPEVGGKSFRIPHMHRGGIVPGAPGEERLAMLQSGERVTSAVGSSAGRTVIELRSGGTALDDALVEILARAIRSRGGDVQLVLGNS